MSNIVVWIPVILRAIDLIEILFFQLKGSGQIKKEVAVARVRAEHVITDDQENDLREAIDRAVTWNNTFGWAQVEITMYDVYGSRFRRDLYKK